MKTIYNLPLIALLLLSGLVFSADSWDEKLGDKEFDKLNFQKAILHYSDAFERFSEPELAEKIADCHRLLNNSNESERWYLSAIELGSMNPQVQYYYADALRSNGKYEDAQYMLQQYLADNPDDQAAKDMFEQFEQIGELLVDKGIYTIDKSTISTDASEYAPAFLGDEKLMYISDQHTGGTVVTRGESWTNEQFDQVWVAELYADGSLGESRIMNEAGINGRFHEGPLTYDETTNSIYFTRSNSDKKKMSKDGKEVVNLKIYKKQLDEGPEKALDEFPFNSDEHTASHPTISEDGIILVFSGDQPGGEGETDLYYSIREDGAWSDPLPVSAEVNTERREMFPFLAADNTLYFASDGHPGLGGLDIYSARYVNGAWTQVENLGVPVNSSKDDFGFVMNRYGKFGFFATNRDNPEQDDIYSFNVQQQMKCIVSGEAIDFESGEALANVKLRLTDSEGNVLAEKRVNREGKYSFQVDPGGTYSLTGSLQQYVDNEYVLSFDKGCAVADIDEGNHEFIEEVGGDDPEDVIINFGMKRDIPVSLKGALLEKGSIKLIRNAKVKITDKQTGKIIFDGRTSPSGEFDQPTDKRAGDEVDYEIRFLKDGYAPKTLRIQEKLKEPGAYSIEAELEELELGQDLGKLLELEPIYFDLGSSDINTNAASELDKIVELMDEYKSMVIELGSHTDSRGSAGFNKSLSTSRAKSSRDYIVAKGIDASRVKSKGYGEAKLLNSCRDGVNCSDTDHQVNRRTEFVILKF